MTYWFSVVILLLLELSQVVQVKKPEKSSTEIQTRSAGSEQLFLNFGMKKKLKDTKLKLENAIMKSRIEVLGEILRTRVHMLLNENKKREIELVFLVDASSSVGVDNFESELKFVRKLIANFKVGPNDTRVAVVTFATTVETHVDHLRDNTSEHEKCSLLNQELPTIRFSGGNTYTLGALQEAQAILNASRPDAKQALFLITDGFSNNGYPVPVAERLKDDKVIIFTFGIKNGNVEELYKMASDPPEEHSFLLESFAEFEALARRALHHDLKTGEYMNMTNKSRCDSLCTKNNQTTSCCEGGSHCSCGTFTGHFVCLCPPGFFGTGLPGEGCQPCPMGTYHDGQAPGDVLACRMCPDRNHETLQVPATSIKDCTCKEGFVSHGTKCQVITCSALSAPSNGYFVKKSCSNVLHAACGVRCNIGYELVGSSVRLCQTDGTWSGVAPSCTAKRCERPRSVAHAEMRCRNEEETTELAVHYDQWGNRTKEVVKTTGDLRMKVKKGTEFPFTIDTQCKFTCHGGYTLVGSKLRTCLPVTRWDGLQTTCKAITCPSLQLIPNGQILPDTCITPGKKLNYGVQCHVSCKPGYLLKGPSTRNCTGKYGTWTGKNTPNRCIDIEPPVIQCPRNRSVPTDYRMPFATIKWPLPEVTDNSGIAPIFWSNPPLGEDEPLRLDIGTIQVQVQALDVAGNTALCTFFITVEDNEPPEPVDCEAPPVLFLSSPRVNDMDWTTPTFEDNSGGMLNITTSHFSTLLTVGSTEIIYTAADQFGNVATCNISVIVLDNPCSFQPALTHGKLSCKLESSVTACEASCDPGYALTQPDSVYTCTHNNSFAFWVPENLDHLSCSASFVPENAANIEKLEIETDKNNCEDLMELSNEIKSEIDSILNSDAISVSANVVCLNETKQRKRRAFKRNIEVNIAISGHSSNFVEPIAMVSNLKSSSEKVRKYLAKDILVKQKGKKLDLKIVGIISKGLNFSCSDGAIPRGDLCVNCPAGTYYNFVNLSCDACPVGEYQPLEGQLSCQHCPERFLTRKPLSKTLSDCKKVCDPGTFGKKRRHNIIGLTPCFKCPVGQYQPEEGKTSCLKCPLGSSTRIPGATQCVREEEIKNPCLRNLCTNNSTCMVKRGFSVCTCNYGFAGAFCERPLSACASTPCSNGGHCKDTTPGKFNCTCLQGYTGLYCEVEISCCESHPCLHGGQCHNIQYDYVCDCVQGYHGKQCEENINDCIADNPCLNNGTCVDQLSGYTCDCQSKNAGRHCEQDVEEQQPVSPCSKIACPFNMVCVEDMLSIRGVRCVCIHGYLPPECNQRIDKEVSLNFLKSSVTNYIAVGLQEMMLDYVSVCLWVLTSDNFNYGTLFSYATFEFDNAFTLTDYNGLVLYIRGERIVTDIIANDGTWHFICVTWSSVNGTWIIYLDGKPEASGTGLAADTSIEGGGTFVIGQEQDRNGGGFNDVEAFVGNMAYIDAWKRILSEQEVELMYRVCEPIEGNLIPWVTFLGNLHGNIQISKSTFCRECEPDLAVLHWGTVTFEADEVSNFARYRCYQGYQIKFQDEESFPTSDSWLRRCNKPGTWEQPVPTCARIRCSFPGYFPHGNLTGRSYFYSDSVTYECHDGYTLHGAATRTCTEDGTWQPEKPFCQGTNVTSCTPLEAPPHGLLTTPTTEGVASDFVPGTEIEFACVSSYELHGPRLLQCTEGGVWDQTPPTCLPTMCQPPNETDLWSYDREKLSSTITVTCNKINRTLTLLCVDGNWNLTTSMCVEMCRTRPKNPEHGYILDDGRSPPLYNSSEVVKVNCRHGYLLEGDDYVTCTDSGTWQQIVNTSCNPINCSEPLNIPHAIPVVPNQTYRYGYRLQYKCLPGFQAYGDLSIRCEAEIRWSRIHGRCVRVFCGKPTWPLTEHNNGSAFLFEDIVEVECNNTKQNISCLSNGKWSTPQDCKN